MAANIGPYKKYKRGTRVHQVEEGFGLGMDFTDTPLNEGFLKTLVNYNMKDKGEILVPRDGLRTFELAVNSAKIISGSEPVEYVENMLLTQGRECAEENNKHYKQIILGVPSEVPIPDTKLYTGQAYVGTVYSPGDTYEDDTEVFPEIEDVALHNMHIESIGAVPFKKPRKAKIHGMPITDTTYIAQAIGTFAFNNSYYCFRDGALVHTKLTKHEDTEKFCYAPEPVEPKVITPKEAVMWGYNMLSEEPYQFENINSAGVIQFLGLLPYDENGALLLSPQVNQTLYLKCNYAVANGAKYTIKWEWKEPIAASWTTIKTETRVFNDLTDLTAEVSIPSQQAMIRISASGWTSGEENDYVDQVLTVGFNFDKAAYGSTANVTAKKYTLSSASGMCYWANSIVLWGIKEDPTLLFVSDVNDPGYFPYPNNADLFDEPVVHAKPLLDDLIVFTTTKVYLLTRTEDGLTWTKKCIQDNLDIQDWDVHLIQTIKNMVFFKSGNYYYMVVPKLNSATGELVIAPISKNIMNFFDNFKPSVQEILKLLYEYNKDITLVHYYNFLDFEDVHNMYVFQTEEGVLLNFDLLYNTISRSWRVHLYESSGILVPYKQDATKKGILMSLVPVSQRWETDEIHTGILPGIQFLQFVERNPVDLYAPANIKVYQALDTLPEEAEEMVLVSHFKNYQYLDTGYREHSTDFNKRYRELQLKINNESLIPLQFHHNFWLDGHLQQTFEKYEVRHDIDPESPDYGTLFLERVLQNTFEILGTTVLAEYETDLECWMLDKSMFPDITTVKVRMPASGKGMTPRLQLLSFNESIFELMNIAWVFRPMYAR